MIGITQGDIGGIGPEIILKLYQNSEYFGEKGLFVLGSFDVINFYKQRFNLDLELHKFNSFQDLKHSRSNGLRILNLAEIREEDIQPGIPMKTSGKLSFESIKTAVQLCSQKKIKAMVTCPVAKESLHLAGHKFNGHTALLANLTGTSEFKLILANPEYAVIHTTMHIPISKVPERITEDNVFTTIKLGREFLLKIGKASPKIAVCGLNPHAGENGIIGDEEIKSIIPAIERCRDLGWAVAGPMPGDVIFQNSIREQYDLIVAQYHDQGHIPTKMVAFETSVNITLGLPIVRTSVDHGTAFDIAGKNKASEANLRVAIDYAHLLSKKL